MVKNLLAVRDTWVPCNAGDLVLIPGLGKPPGEGNGYPLQYPGLEHSMDSIVHGGHKKSDTTAIFTFIFRYDTKSTSNERKTKQY